MCTTPAATSSAGSFQPALFDEEDSFLDLSFATARRVQLDQTAWIEHVSGWLNGSGRVLDTVLKTVAWEQRQRWMYTRTVIEPRLTAAASGDLIVMGGTCQRRWQHCAPKQKTPAGPRARPCAAGSAGGPSDGTLTYPARMAGGLGRARI
jgi:hypothetical protein